MGPLLLSLAAAHAAPPRGPDFDNDGYEDLAIGMPDENVSAATDAGMLIVVYGSAAGPVRGGERTEYVYEDLSTASVSVAHEHFAASVAWGDFDHDCYDDLAVGIPGEEVAGVSAAGAVHVYSGGPSGLDLAHVRVIHRASPGMAGDPEHDAHFGSALAAGDFDGDGVDDLASGAPHDPGGAAGQAGSVHLVYGGPAGLDGTDSRRFDRGDIDGDLTHSDRFGTSLAAGDFDDDGRDDLAIGAPDATGGGGIAVLYGSASGLSTTIRTPGWWLQTSSSLDAGGAVGDRLGMAGSGSVTMLTADFDGNGCADLAVGVQGMDLAGTDTGGVRVLYGTPTAGLQVTSPDDQLWRISDTAIGAATDDDRFGFTLAVGRFDTDGYDDLAVGSLVDGEAGAVHVLRGWASGITGVSDRSWHLGVGPVGGFHSAGDRFGGGLGSADLDGNGVADLVVGVPGMDLNAATSGGALFTLMMAPASVPTVTEVWTAIQEEVGDGQSSEPYDLFGKVLAPARRVPMVCSPTGPGGLEGG
ncbi:MAG: FG-GAP repeat protein [Myxococcota bacterium]